MVKQQLRRQLLHGKYNNEKDLEKEARCSELYNLVGLLFPLFVLLFVYLHLMQRRQFVDVYVKFFILKTQITMLCKLNENRQYFPCNAQRIKVNN